MSNLASIASSNQLDTTFTVNGKQFTNNSNLPFEIAYLYAWASSQYDGKPTTSTNLSASDLMLPMRKLIYKCTQSADQSNEPVDVAKLASSAKGTILHSALEEALTQSNLGYTQEVRSEHIFDINGVSVNVNGKFDLVTSDGMIKDLKHVSPYPFEKLTAEREQMQPGHSIDDMLQLYPNYTKYVLQLSIYRFLNLQLITKPFGSILFVLNSRSLTITSVEHEITFPLFPHEQIEEWITDKLHRLHEHLADGTMPDCTPVDRGTSTPEYKLTRVGPSGKSSTVRGSKFTDYQKFLAFVATKGKPGDTRVELPITHKLCDYCFANSYCDQPV